MAMGVHLRRTAARVASAHVWDCPTGCPARTPSPGHRTRKTTGFHFTKGRSGSSKNLTFPADGTKPQIVLRDAVNNDVDILRHADTCLVFTAPLPPHGLARRQMVIWSTQQGVPLAPGVAQLGELLLTCGQEALEALQVAVEKVHAVLEGLETDGEPQLAELRGRLGALPRSSRGRRPIPARTPPRCGPATGGGWPRLQAPSPGLSAACAQIRHHVSSDQRRSIPRPRVAVSP